MKTKEEIEKLAKKEAEKLHDKSKHEDWDIYHQLVHEDTELIKIGYTQCQEDNKDKKYTEEDMRKAYQEGKSYVADTQPYFDNFEQFINSLNK